MNNTLNEEKTLKDGRENGLELLLDFEKGNELVPVIAQDYQTGQVLMLAYANDGALRKTIEVGYATFYSRSRDELWTKGETSGNRLIVKDILVDCDQDALVYLVKREKGGACHTKNVSGIERISCFYRKLNPEKTGLEFLEGLK